MISESSTRLSTGNANSFPVSCSVALARSTDGEFSASRWVVAGVVAASAAADAAGSSCNEADGDERFPGRPFTRNLSGTDSDLLFESAFSFLKNASSSFSRGNSDREDKDKDDGDDDDEDDNDDDTDFGKVGQDQSLKSAPNSSPSSIVCGR